MHRERRVARPHRVVLVSHRRAEQGHESVISDVIDAALVPPYCVDHGFEDWIEQLARRLGVTTGHTICCFGEIGEKDGDLSALTLHGSRVNEDPFGEGWRHRRGPSPRSSHPALSQPEALELVPQCGARNAEPVRRCRDVATRLVQGLLHPSSGERIDRRLQGQHVGELAVSRG